MRLYIKYRMNSDMNKRDLKKLTKAQLIRLLLKQEKIGQAQKQIANESENSIVSQPKQEEQPEQFRDRQKKQRPPKPTRRPSPPPIPFDFDYDIFQTENESLEKFKIINVQSRQNKKFKSFTNEFKVKILKRLDDVNEIYHIFQELIKNVKRKRKLSNNDRFRFVIQNEELPDAISTKFNKVQDFKLGDL